MTKNIFQKILLGLLLLIFGVLVSQKINLVTADLGRHLKNGEIILKGEKKVLFENYYSYTYSNYVFVNHHWLSGVIFYGTQKFFGFRGLSLFFTLLNLALFLVFFQIARKKAGFIAAFLTAIILLPLLANRTEIRPEIFSYLLAGIFWWILESNKREVISNKLFLYLLPLLMILWVNLHIYFFLGFFLIGLYFVFEKEQRGKLLIIGVLTFLAALLNPIGIKGVLYPLNIFRDYGYLLFENQSVKYIDNFTGGYAPNLYFKIAFGVLVVSWVCRAIKEKILRYTQDDEENSHSEGVYPPKNLSKENDNGSGLVLGLAITAVFSYLGWSAIRNFPLFAFFCWPVIAGNFSGIINGIRREYQSFALASLVILLAFFIFVVNPGFWLRKTKIGFGLEKGSDGAAQFLLKNKTEGPIFNNYDIGGYLIYYLFPREKVFVDNRPEAYPTSFFKDVYVPMQEKQEEWKKQDEKYHFKTIVFNRNDLTQWGQSFLARITADKNWVLSYKDGWTVVFLRKNPE